MPRLVKFAVCAALLSGVASVAIAQPSAPIMTYEMFVTRAQALVPGQTRAEIVSALGTPTKQGKMFLAYSLTGLKGMPPPPGTTVYYAAEITLRDGRMVGAVKWAWMDTTGPAPPASH